MEGKDRGVTFRSSIGSLDSIFLYPVAGKVRGHLSGTTKQNHHGQSGEIPRSPRAPNFTSQYRPGSWLTWSGSSA
jgi:hypothetical protein